jgi:hypothetical protein
MKIGCIKLETTIGQSYYKVKKTVLNKDGKLLKFMLPLGYTLVHYKGIRRGAIIKIMNPFGTVYTYKLVTYSTSKNKTTYHSIWKEGKMLSGIKFWPHRHFIEQMKGYTIIKEVLTFTTKNRSIDFFLHIFIKPYFWIRSLKYKIFFLFN